MALKQDCRAPHIFFYLVISTEKGPCPRYSHKALSLFFAFKNILTELVLQRTNQVYQLNSAGIELNEKNNR